MTDGLEKWRELFRGADIYDVIDHAILVAAADSPQEFRRRRDSIAERFYTTATTSEAVRTGVQFASFGECMEGSGLAEPSLNRVQMTPLCTPAVRTSNYTYPRGPGVMGGSGNGFHMGAPPYQPISAAMPFESGSQSFIGYYHPAIPSYVTGGVHAAYGGPYGNSNAAGYGQVSHKMNLDQPYGSRGGGQHNSGYCYPVLPQYYHSQGNIHNGVGMTQQMHYPGLQGVKHLSIDHSTASRDELIKEDEEQIGTDHSADVYNEPEAEEEREDEDPVYEEDPEEVEIYEDDVDMDAAAAEGQNEVNSSKEAKAPEVTEEEDGVHADLSGFVTAPGSSDNTETKEKSDQLLQISVYATPGLNGPVIFPLMVNIGSQHAVTLVDSGSTNSFIDYEVVMNNRYSMSLMACRRVTMAGGGKLTSDATSAFRAGNTPKGKDMDDNDHDTSNANTTEEAEESEFECENQDCERPVDMLSVPVTKLAMKTGEYAQTIKDAKWMEKKKEKVVECILSFFLEAGIPFNAVCKESFQLMLEAIGQFDPGLRGPSPEEFRGPFLQEQVSIINDSIEALKKSWAWEGCSIMLESWTDINGRRLMDLAVHCVQGLAFLRSIHLSSETHDDAYIFRLVDSCIEEIGEKNVVHVVTNIEANNMVAKMFTAKRPNIFWTQCAACCIDLMLEDIGHIGLIKNTVAKARSITAFSYGRTCLLDMMHQFTKQWDLIQIGITRSTTSYLNLKSLYDKRIELKTMFISKEWEDSKWSKEAVGKKFYNLVVSNKFWHGVHYVINVFEPLVDVLRRMGSGILP